jgi:hypothetical protein
VSVTAAAHVAAHQTNAPGWLILAVIAALLIWWIVRWLRRSSLK